MNIGTLNKRIIIEKSIPYDEDDITKEKWLPYKTIWANANNLFGEEFWKAKECGYENVVMFKVRYSKDTANINSREYRIKFGKRTVNIFDKDGNVIDTKEVDRLYNIIGIDNVQYSNTFIKIKAKEVEI